MKDRGFHDKISTVSPLLLLYEENMERSRESYVMAHHVRSIMHIEKQGLYKTYVGTPRVSVTRKEYKDLISFLYDYYQRETGTYGTLDDALEKYLDTRRKWGRADGTIERIRIRYTSLTPIEMRSMQMRDLTSESIRTFLGGQLGHLKEVRGTTVAIRQFRDYLQVLKAVLDCAVMNGSIDSNPAASISLEEFRGRCNCSRKTPDEKMMLPSQLQAVLKEAEEDFPNPRAWAVYISAHTGLRAGELPCIRWSDISNGMIHIHRSQRIKIVNGKRVGFEELPWTKDEKGYSKGGRYVPILPECQNILSQISEHNRENNIHSEFVFCNKDGSWITKDSYSLYLRRLCKRLGFSVTNNHALRMAFNSNVLIPAGLDVRERALILGHSIQVNEAFYSFSGSHLYEGIRDRLSSLDCTTLK